MSDSTVTPVPDVTPEHDHAWRRVDGSSDLYGGVGEYRCDLCPATWSM
jgi:hypothetical protein